MVQLALPDAVVANNGPWDDPDGVFSGADLWQALDDGVTNTDDNTSKLRSIVDPTFAAYFEASLSDVTDPGVSSGHVLRIRGRCATTAVTHNIEFYLYQGSTLIATGTGTWNTNVFGTLSYALSGAEADAITDYTDLRIRFAADQTGAPAARAQVTGVELEVPDVSGAFDIVKVEGETLQGNETDTKVVAADTNLVTIVGADFYLDGVILNSGSLAEGLLMNVRLVQSTIDFSAETEVTNWDADANTAAFIAELPNYKAKGVNAITVSFQGGNFQAGWGESYDAGAWNSDGSIRASHAARMTDVIEGCLANDIIPIVSLTYFRQDQILTNEAAVLAMVESAKTFLAPWKNKIIIEVTNESENALVSHAILQEDRNFEIVDDLVAEGFFASASHHSGVVPTAVQQGDGQVVLLHGNGETVAGITTMINSAKSTFPTLPIVINEDGAIDRTAQDHIDRSEASVAAGAGWGYHEPTGLQYWDGTNMTTMDWDIDNAIILAAFDSIDALTESAAFDIVKVVTE